MPKKKTEKETKNILVWFGETKSDVELRKRITDRCDIMSESSYLKEAAREKLDREEMFNNAINAALNNAINNAINSNTISSPQQNTPQKSDESIPEFDVDTFVDSID